MAYEGGNDLFASDAPMVVTDLIRGTQYEVNVIDFYIDENNIGYVYFDEEEIFSQSNIESYDVLENLFYAQYSVEM